MSVDEGVELTADYPRFVPFDRSFRLIVKSIGAADKDLLLERFVRSIGRVGIKAQEIALIEFLYIDEMKWFQLLGALIGQDHGSVYREILDLHDAGSSGMDRVRMLPRTDLALDHRGLKVSAVDDLEGDIDATDHGGLDGA